MSACGGISLGADYDCDNPIAAGVNQRLILINRDDIATVAYNVTTPTLIEGITLKAGGKAAYAFQGIRQSLQPSSAFVPQTVSVGYDHQVDFLVFDITQQQKDNLEKMALSKMVAIVENKNATGNGNSVFEVFGLNVGMEVQTNTRSNTSLESAGAYQVSLKTSDNEGKEPKLPQSFFLTDYTTTLALVDALLTPTA